MLLTRGYRVELDLSDAHITACRKHTGAARWAYNYGLRRKQEAYRAGEKTPTAIDLHREINALKKNEIPWAYDVSKCAMQEGLRDLDNAFKHFFRKCRLKKEGTWKGTCGYPRWKSKKKAIGGARFTGAIRVYPDAVQLPRLGLLRLKERDYLPMNVKIKSATISEKAGRWYVSIVVQSEQPEPPQATGASLGVDLGIKTLAVVSDGRAFENPKALRKKINALKRASRRHGRKKKGSKNRDKAKQRLARMHARIANVRKDALHKVTSALVARTKPASERPACIVLEDLNISGMLKNRKLSRAIADVGMYAFKQQVLYKAALAGVQVKLASHWEPSSKTCHLCGWVKEDLTLAIRMFVCEDCGLVMDRDLNAAYNLAVLA
ncbi:RNA-guided endonuclease InsQ/TnpB family protein [Ktedonospora formicarum]|uniref:Transposase n=1 Tax=Ktedonospora formicarum TaxID=2778364 RepID=A0A8J3MXJ0_9CHLR|nr:RNA-guided endonuclease TnpB family protein [Ktedonospora formicarum]GHO49798.1 transposase [Ktedonospora formicarum]